MWKWLSYTWRVAINLVYVLAVLYVFSHLYERDLTIIVAALGLIYVTVRSVAIGQFLGHMPILIGLSKASDEIKVQMSRKPVAMIGGQTTDDEVADLIEEAAAERLKETYDEAERKLQTTMVKLYIESGFLALISLICLFQLFSAL